MIIIGIILTVIGVLLLLSFILSRVKCKTETEAIVSKIIEKKRYFRGRTIKEYTPVFTYTANQKKYTEKADLSTSDPKKYFVGKQLTVFIDENHPEKVRYGSNIVFCFAGIAFAALGIFIIVLFFI